MAKEKRRVTHPKEEWSEKIVDAKRGDKKAIEWLNYNVERMLKKIRRDEDDVQDLMLHFNTKVLPSLDPKYLPIPIIYKSAKRILINLHKRDSRKKFKEDRVIEHISSVSNSESYEIDDGGMEALSKMPETIKVLACCRMSVEIINMINNKITLQMLKNIASKYLEVVSGQNKNQPSLFEFY